MIKRWMGIGLLCGMMAGCVSVSSRTSAPLSEAPSVHVEELAKTTRSWDGALLPSYPEGQPEVTILRITIPPGTQLAAHYHPVINAGVLLKGQLTVVAEDGSHFHLTADDAIVELVDTMHYGVNDGNDPAEIIVFYAGIEDGPITVTP